MLKYMWVKNTVFLCLLCCAAAGAEETRFDAVLQWARTVELGLLESGIVQEVSVKTGQRVKQGERLLRLEQGIYKAALEAAKAAVEESKADVQEAARELERVEELHAQVLISNHELELAKNALTRAKARAGKARAALIEAEMHRAHSELRAPFAGIIIERRVEAGQAVVNRCQSQVLLVLAETPRMLARASIPAAEASALETGRGVRIQAGGNEYNGGIETVALQANAENGYNLDVIFEGGAELRPGMGAVIHIPR